MRACGLDQAHVAASASHGRSPWALISCRAPAEAVELITVKALAGYGASGSIFDGRVRPRRTAAMARRIVIIQRHADATRRHLLHA